MIKRVAAVQMAIVEGDAGRNRARASQLIASAPGADLYLLPELFTSGYAFDAWPSLAANDFAAAYEWMRATAIERIAFVAGSVIARADEGKLANRFLLFDRDGNERLRYDKAHLFSALHEDAHMTPGAMPTVVELEGLRVAPAICYDLRFPEMFRRVALTGVDLFLVPSEWPHPRQRPMSVLAEARAIENQAFLLLANRSGPDANGVVYCGHSGVFTPFGAIVTAGEGESVVTAELDLTLLEKSRKLLRVFDDRRASVDYT